MTLQRQAIEEAAVALSEALLLLYDAVEDANPEDLEAGVAALTVWTEADQSMIAVNSSIQTLLVAHHDRFEREGKTKVFVHDGCRMELSGGTTNTTWESARLADVVKNAVLDELVEAYGPRNAPLIEGVVAQLDDRYRAVSGFASNKSAPWRSKALRDAGVDPDTFSEKHTRPKKVRIPR